MPPVQLSHYRIVAQLGRGAMGEVYRAVDQRLGREVALELLPREVEGDAGWQARLLRDAQAASALNHPGIVTLLASRSGTCSGHQARVGFVIAHAGGPHLRCPEQIPIGSVGDRGAGLTGPGR